MAGKNRAVCGWRTGSARRAGRRRPSAGLRRLLLSRVGTAGLEESCPRGRQTLHRAAGPLRQRATADAAEKQSRATCKAMAEMECARGIGVLAGCNHVRLALASIGIQR